MTPTPGFNPQITRVTPLFFGDDSSDSGTTYVRSCIPCSPCYPDSQGSCSPCTPCYPDSQGDSFCAPCTPCYPDTARGGPCSPAAPCSPCSPCYPDT